MINDKLTKDLQEQITENKDDIAGNNIYSTSETNTHKKWVNGKTIYRKVIITNTIIEKIPTNITNLEDLIEMKILVSQKTEKDWRNIPWLYATGTTLSGGTWAGGVFYKVSENVLFFQLGNSLKEVEKMIAILEYTKTTD